MNPRDWLDLADVLAAGIREAEWRGAVGRAYYAAFHVARQLLRQCQFDVPRGEQAHAYLWLRLTNSGHPDVEQAGRRLDQLRRDRNRADYDLGIPLDQRDALNRAQTAQDVIDLLDAIATTPSIRTQITDAMKVYERDVLGQVTWHP
jgi:uncharacterized protein (UPF0332 family)